VKETAAEIVRECDEIKGMLLEKNRAYGDSAVSPVRVFSKATAVEQLLVRIDDKISRIMRGSAAGEDAILDLIGYLILLRVARRVSPAKCTKCHINPCPPYRDNGECDECTADRNGTR
jgi:hypothetical protein